MGAAVDLWLGTGRSGMARLFRLPRADWGRAVAHAGFGVTVFGIAGLTAWQSDDIRVAQLGQPFDMGGYTLTLTDVQRGEGPNYFATTGFVTLAKNGREIAQLRPEKRVYPVAQMPTTEAAIDQSLARRFRVAAGARKAQAVPAQ